MSTRTGGRFPSESKVALLGAVVLFGSLALVSAGGGAEEPREGLGELSFEEIVVLARGSEVGFYMWGGSDTINAWIDGFVSDRMGAVYDIDVERVPMDAAVFVNRLFTEMQAGQDTGTIDLVWINGENFRNARDA
ncbi:MAG: hypothetical protein MI724_16185, partial [Spirochaetales bacterium]|nr:hypothetical protein [Spirochaetales bacterium]